MTEEEKSTPPGQRETPAEREKTRPMDNKETDKEEDIFYYPLSTCHLPVYGIPPEELAPGDKIYGRVKGELVENFPESLQSARLENTTISLETTVEKIRPVQELPSEFEGDPEDYYRIDVRFLGDKMGTGLVYKDSKLKPLQVPEQSVQPGVTVPILIGVGLLLGLIGGLSYVFFLL